MIEDPELRDLFASEAEEYLNRLESGFLRLDAGDRDPNLIEEVFRQAHSLKGAARMLGVRPVEALTHLLEDRLVPIRRGRRDLSRGEVTLMLGCLDALRRLVAEAVTGEPAGVDEDALAKALTASRDEPEPRAQEYEDPPSIRQPDPAEAAGQEPLDGGTMLARPAEQPGGALKTSQPPNRGSLRLDPHFLDSLMEEAGELVLLRARLARRLQATQAVLDEWEADEAAGPRARPCLSSIVSGLRQDLSQLDRTVDALEQNLRQARLIPADTLFRLFPRMLRDLALESGQDVELRMEGGEILADRKILADLKDALIHLVRNAVDHGLEDGAARRAAGKPERGLLVLAASRSGGEFVLEVRDDGRGLDHERLKAAAARLGLHDRDELERMGEAQLRLLAFRAGLSTRERVTEVSGRGIGLSAVRERVVRMGGRVEVETVPSKGTTFRLAVPVSLTSMRVLLVRVGEGSYALPLDAVLATRLLARQEIGSLGGVPAINHRGESIPVVGLASLLGLPAPLLPEDQSWPAVLLMAPHGGLAVLVDEVIEDQEVVVRSLGPLLEEVPHLIGASPLSDGGVALVLDASSLLEAASNPTAPPPPAPGLRSTRQRILLAEDSLATRVQLQRVLEGAGFEVLVAVDGQAAWEHLQHQAVDGILSDINMPRLDGLELTRRIRAHPRFRELPVVLLTSLASEEDRRRGLELGADAYLTKQAFQHDLLLATLRRLL